MLLKFVFYRDGKLVYFVSYVVAWTFLVSFKGFRENFHGAKVVVFKSVVSSVCSPFRLSFYSPSFPSSLSLSQGPPDPVQGILAVMH